MGSDALQFELLQPLLEVVREAGRTREELFGLAEVRAVLEASASPLSESSQRRIVQAAMKLIGDPSLGLRIGQRIHVASLGTFGFALMSCVDLADVIKLLIRYHPIVTTDHRLECFEHETGMIVRAGPYRGSPDTRQLARETLFSSMCSIGEFLINRPIDRTELHFDYATPDHHRAYRELFSIPVKFDMPHCQLVLHDDLLSTRLRTANPGGHVIFQQECEELLRTLNREENFSAAVRRLLIHAGRSFPHIAEVADRLHVSERTLRRRLKAEASSFREICDEVRNVLASQYLTDTEFTVAEIANLLGYTETVSFRRAFARWNGTTPGRYRIVRRRKPSPAEENRR